MSNCTLSAKCAKNAQSFKGNLLIVNKNRKNKIIVQSVQLRRDLKFSCTGIEQKQIAHFLESVQKVCKNFRITYWLSIKTGK